MTCNISFEDTERLRVFRDGDQFCITLDNFVDLQQTPNVYWLHEDSYLGELLKPWVGVSPDPLIHIPHIDRFNIAHHLLCEYTMGGYVRREHP